MNRRLIGVTGILVTVIFSTGFLVLFVSNPQAFEELNNVSLATYNLEGMNGRMWAAIFIYLTVGLLNTLFCIGLLAGTGDRSVVIVGKILLLISGTLWLTFGLFPYNPQTYFGINLMLARIVAIILTGSVGLIILGHEFDKITKDNFLKWYTLSSGFLIMLLSFMSAFIFNDETWIRTNFSLTIYFLWFGVFGLRYL